MQSTHLFFLACFAVLVNGHMIMTEPKPLLDPKNPNTKNGDFDYSAPLSKSGTNFPCKGHHKVMGTPEGASVASWAAGSQQSFTIGGGASHGGGSCQAALSEDGGTTWKVMASYVGDCPQAGQPYSFTVPPETKNGDVMFAWTWFNKVGNREMYMNCAAITITGGSGSGLGSYPDLFTANIGNGCFTTEGTDVLFPNVGRNVINTSKNTGPPTGSCAGGG
ncbi:Lytic polysaccharide monooxygenase, partial [Tuber magnatum]